MPNLTRFNPLSEIARFDPFRDFEDAFRLPRSFMRTMREEPQMKMDVSEDDKAYHVKADIPGVRKEDIKVSIDGDRVSISTEFRKEKEEKKGETLISSERYYGSQFRGFSLQQAVDAAKADAKYENGVLELTLPKREAGAARTVKIQ